MFYHCVVLFQNLICGTQWDGDLEESPDAIVQRAQVGRGGCVRAGDVFEVCYLVAIALRFCMKHLKHSWL